jgi:hypothetical protein
MSEVTEGIIHTRKQLDILGALRAGEQQEQSEEPQEDQVEQAQRHERGSA